jgi:hypothetical protein
MVTRNVRFRSHRWIALFLTAALTAPVAAIAGPTILEETARIATPDPTYTFPVSIAVDGDWLIAAGERGDPEYRGTENSTWLYQRQADGTWSLVRRLHYILYNDDGDEPLVKVAMQGGVAVIVKEAATAIFERSGTNWIAMHSPIVTDGRDIAVNGGTIVATTGYCDWSTNVYRKGASGAWTLVRSTPPEFDPDFFCENEVIAGDADVASNGTTTIVATLGFGTSARIFEGPFGTAPTMTRLVSPVPRHPLGYIVAIENNSAVVASALDQGPQAYTRNANGQWINSGSLRSPDLLALRGGPEEIQMSGGLAILTHPYDRLHGAFTGSVGVFQRNADGTYRHFAKLLASDRDDDHYFGFSADVSGRRVAAGSFRTQSVYIYDLPTTLTQPVTVQDSFEDGNASDWTPLAGSSFAVATTSTSRIYRQSSTAGNAASLWNNTDRTNQSIEADIKPTAYATTTGDKWFGLVARYTDANNYYYVTLRNNNTLLLRRMVNGTFTTLASADLPVALNRNYRVRIEAIGTRLRVFVDNRLLAEASDSSHARGQAGVMMFRTRADYDNVVVSANPQTLLASFDWDYTSDDTIWNWQSLGTWAINYPNSSYDQTDTGGGARAIVGLPIDNQVVHTRVRRAAAAGTNNWFGVAARYRDANNYYYVTLRNDNSISLRKLVNGAITELDSAPLTIASNSYYRIRFEAIDTQLRVYINDVLRLEATDASHASGRYGPVMYRTAAQYDYMHAFEP